MHSFNLIRKILLLHQLLTLVGLTLLVTEDLSVVVFAKQSSETNPPLDVGLELKVGSSETGSTEELVHLLERLALRLRDEEVDPRYTNAGNGTEEDECTPGRLVKEWRGGEADSCDDMLATPSIVLSNGFRDLPKLFNQLALPPSATPFARIDSG